MPDEEIIEEGVLNPLKPAVQDPLLQQILQDAAPRPYSRSRPRFRCRPMKWTASSLGLGAGGAPLLARLAMAGLKVVALEAGPWHDPKTDFATDEKAQEFLFWNDERLSAGKDPVAFGKNNSGTGVGGSTLHYTAYTPRAQPDDLHLHRDFGVGRGLALRLRRARAVLRRARALSGHFGADALPLGTRRRRKGYPLAPLPLNGAAQLMERGLRTARYQDLAGGQCGLVGALLPGGRGLARGLHQPRLLPGWLLHRAPKPAWTSRFLPLAVPHGAEIRPNCFVTEIERDEQGRVTGVVYSTTASSSASAAATCFSCAGAVETPRLLLLNELALSSGHVGRNLMAHPGVQVWGTFPEDMRPYKGIPGGLDFAGHAPPTRC